MALDFYADNSNWMSELFGVKKPIIALHVDKTILIAIP